MYLGHRLRSDLSAFNHATHRWTTIPLRDPHDPITQRSSSHPADAIGKQRLSLTSWNIRASQSGSVARSKAILDHIFKGPKFSDVILLQEVTSRVWQSLLDDPRVRSGFLTTYAEDDASFKGQPFATRTLLSNERFGSPLLAEGGEVGGGKLMLDSAFRMKLPSRHKRDAHCVNIVAPATRAVLRLINVHLDSFDSSTSFRRAVQIQVLTDVLRESECSGGIIAGNFNAITPEDHRLIDEQGLLDAWVALHESTTRPDGATWCVSAGPKGAPKAGRLDKVVMLGLKPNEIEVLQPGLIKADRLWSDHCGLRCTFTI